MLLLNVNVTFLSIVSVDTAAPVHRSPAQITSLASTIVSLFSGLLGVLLYRRICVQRLDTAADAVRNSLPRAE